MPLTRPQVQETDFSSCLLSDPLSSLSAAGASSLVSSLGFFGASDDAGRGMGGGGASGDAGKGMGDGGDVGGRRDIDGGRGIGDEGFLVGF
jgi:hypothetical protein